MRLVTLLLALLLAPVPMAANAALVDFTFAGSVTGYDPYTDPGETTFFAALPIGTALSGAIRFDADFPGGTVPAVGTVLIGGNSYAATQVYGAGGGINVGGVTYTFVDFYLAGPTIPSVSPDYAPGVLSLTFGLPYPDPLGPQISLYLYNEIRVGFFDVGGFGGYNDFASVTIRGNVAAAAVPEPVSWAMILLGFGGVGCAVRRRRSAAIA